MIKFFRRIRQKLLSENKFSKYLIYAIGEIILVVIGILIALQINNWNEERKATKGEHKLFQQILIDLKNEDTILKDAVRSYKKHIDLYYHIYDETIDKTYYDSTAGIYNYIRWHNIFDITVTIKYRNNTSEITSANILELLNEKADIESDVLQGKQDYNDFKDETIIPFFIRIGVYDINAVFKSEKYKFSPLLDINIIRSDRLKSQEVSAELDQILVELIIKSSWTIDNIEKLMKKNNEISLALREELNK